MGSRSGWATIKKNVNKFTKIRIKKEKEKNLHEEYRKKIGMAVREDDDVDDEKDMNLQNRTF